MCRQQNRVPIILLLENDDDTRRALVDNLRQRGYKVIVAVDRESALDWITYTVINFDILLINQVNISVQECLKMTEEIYHRGGLTLDTPAIILAEEFQDYLEGKVENTSDRRYIIYLDDAQKLFELIDSLCFDRE